LDTYFDSGALVKIYAKEPYSEEVILLVSKEPRILFTLLHNLEIRNALRAQTGRGIILLEECEKSLAALDEDIETNRLKFLNPDWGVVYKKAEELSILYTKNILCRALDILHVSCALFFSCTRFITGDKRQAELARKLELKVHLIGQRRLTFTK
jgi:predicted nucleic acid-binding protein